MRLNGRLLLAASLAAAVALCGCRSDDAQHHMEHPAHVEHIDGSDISKVTLTEQAMARVDVQTARVGVRQEEGVTHMVVPYSSLIYDPHGHTWVYTSPQPRTFVRQAVNVDRIEGDWVLLSKGPAAGSEVASVGVAELYGTEFEVGH
jgi:hypothetical protein